MNTTYVFRFLESALLFAGVPLLFYWNLIPIPKIVALLLIMLICMIVLRNDSSYHFKDLKYRPMAAGTGKKIFVRSIVIAASLFMLTFIIQPDKLFSFPRERPFLWLIVMALYPVLSVVPQEIIYRKFFFHRYKSIFGSQWLMVISSAFSFSFLHIVYDNIWALVLSFIGGLLFARSYQQSQSLYRVSIEHAIYGCLVFTIGMGQYFYEGF